MAMETLYLSERNLRTLLSKLERRKNGEPTAGTLIKHKSLSEAFQQSMDAVMVVAVLDEEYYPALDRQPGFVLPVDDPNLNSECTKT